MGSKGPLPLGGSRAEPWPYLPATPHPTAPAWVSDRPSASPAPAGWSPPRPAPRGWRAAHVAPAPERSARFPAPPGRSSRAVCSGKAARPPERPRLVEEMPLIGVPRDRSQRVVHAVARHHLERDLGRERSGRRRRRWRCRRRRSSRRPVRPAARRCGSGGRWGGAGRVIGRPLDRVAEGADAARDDRDLPAPGRPPAAPWRPPGRGPSHGRRRGGARVG